MNLKMGETIDDPNNINKNFDSVDLIHGTLDVDADHYSFSLDKKRSTMPVHNLGDTNLLANGMQPKSLNDINSRSMQKND